MKVQNAGAVSKSERVFQSVKRIVLSGPGKVMFAVAVVGGLASIPLATVAGDHNDKDGAILQVMPWPVFGLKTDRDLNAIYEYLTSIPSLSGPGSRDP